MRTQIKTLSAALCAAIVAMCFASCFATDPAAVYSKAYSTSYGWAMANGCNQKQADALATRNAENARDEAMGAGINTGAAPDVGYDLAHIPEQDMSNRAAAAVQTGGTQVPPTMAASAASTVCPPTMHH